MIRPGIGIRFVFKTRPPQPDPPARPRPTCSRAGCDRPTDWLSPLCDEHAEQMRQAVIRGQQERDRRRLTVDVLRQLGAPRSAIARRLRVCPATVREIERKIARDAERWAADQEAPVRRARARQLLAAAAGILAALDPIDPEP